MCCVSSRQPTSGLCQKHPTYRALPTADVWAALTIATVTVVSERLKASSSSSTTTSGSEVDEPSRSSSSSSKSRGQQEICEPAARALSAALALAVSGGLLVCTVLQAWGPHLILATGADPLLLPSALTYLRSPPVAAGLLALIASAPRCLCCPVVVVCGFNEVSCAVLCAG